MDDSALTIPAAGRQRLDSRLHEVHTACAVLWLVGVSGPISVVELAGAPMGICFIIRAAVCRRLWIAPLRSPLAAVLALWFGWQGLSLLWSPNVRQGLDEMGVARWGWWLWMVYPVIDRRRTLIAAYATGFLLGHMTQVIQYFAPGAVWHRQPDRFSGWWAPVAGGVILCSALGLHLPAAFMGRGRTRIAGTAGALAAALGILLTGTRSAWLAGAALVGGVGVFALVRLGRTSLRSMALIAAVAIGGAGATWLVAGPSIASRFRSATSEIESAIHARDLGAFNTDTGARLLMNWWAVRAFARHPAVGIGAGGYRDWVLANEDTAGLDPTRVHDQAHSSVLHIAAVNGGVGLLIAAAVVAVALRQARAHISDGPAGGWGGYDAGPFFALIGLLLVSATNTIHISAQPAAHLAALFALCPPLRRGAVGGPPA